MKHKSLVALTALVCVFSVPAFAEKLAPPQAAGDHAQGGPPPAPPEGDKPNGQKPPPPPCGEKPPGPPPEGEAKDGHKPPPPPPGCALPPPPEEGEGHVPPQSHDGPPKGDHTGK